MRCEVCKTHDANAEVRMNVNGVKRELHVCAECLSKLRSSYKSPVSMGPFGGFPSMDEMFELFSLQSATQPGPAGQVPSAGNGGRGGFLDEYGRNLTVWAKQGRIDPVIGRDKEVSRVIEILNRRNKNNPVLIGEPGVGKTAIAEGLAVRIVEGKVPAKLRDKQVYNLDVSSLVADTGIRGQFEERMNNLISELQSRSDVILFIDEIHLLVGAGSAQGSMDAGNILKPALARGDIQVIGATTLKEYRQIEKDAALERRFQPVMVDEPTIEEAIQILQGIRPKYEAYHQVRFTDEAIAACVNLSNRYISDRFLPDKAIDLLDEAGSKANLRLSDNQSQDFATQLENVIREKAEATKVEAYERAAELHKEELRLRELMKETPSAKMARVEVTALDIQQIVEEKTGIPVRKIQESEQSKLRDLEQDLSSRVIGQAEAVKKVAKAVRRSRTGLRKGERPIGSFLFVGPTGVGKTELAKSLALSLFGDKDAMIRLDMSEYMEKHSVSKLIGSPPGYVGYDEAGQLTEQVRRNPYSLILLDEIEKAHPDVQHMFLQIMEDGRLTDSQGRTVSFKDTILIMTSNAGITERKAALGFSVEDASGTGLETTETQIGQLSSYFKPEFLNRFDAIVDFAPLTKADLAKIVLLFLDELKGILAQQEIELSWTDAAVERLGQLGYHPQYGARPLRRVIQDQVEDQIADVLVDQPNANALVIDVDEDSADGGNMGSTQIVIRSAK
ncbi:ATP-dependent Clp protease ATP-binding subunit [Alicyclobacillus fastidiosus]|uniref:ATP-dependent Clp protease ATP-binding subunit n=1 Tax=Alicyclobacillus fastidiosus TaxID=392011 RepID=A0ABY6ZDY4_9BACL|nr:ATP-dependent Clp protease ATP-binding subunit [Alicyclobacillus fastidiosus]WAH41104.1 ATP-dependent Clp protease ATP-binding subunit [Alicyclobacillus fastidiosus]GMA62658.1 ATP-dependent Clp protease ATP-binding subunit ClpE [Alicyclobacillus fastidiosus]